MRTRISVLSLVRITFWLASLGGCDEPGGGFDEPGFASSGTSDDSTSEGAEIPGGIEELERSPDGALNELPAAYGRGAGTPPHYGCTPDQEQSGLLCYPPCAPEYYGLGPICWQRCGPGYSDMGAYCINYGVFGWPSHWKLSHSRGAGSPLVSTCDAGLEYDAGLCYPPCADCYDGVGPVCWSLCTNQPPDTP